MGVGQRLLDLARANLNALMDRASRAELDGVSEEQLEAELKRRQAERDAQHVERKQRLAAEEAARRRSASPRTRGAARRATEDERRATRTLELYEVFGVRAHAPLEDVKRSYRALMREHHPDRHAGDPARQKAASDRSAEITVAYAELELLITERR